MPGARLSASAESDFLRSRTIGQVIAVNSCSVCFEKEHNCLAVSRSLTITARGFVGRCFRCLSLSIAWEEKALAARWKPPNPLIPITWLPARAFIACSKGLSVFEMLSLLLRHSS